MCTLVECLATTEAALGDFSTSLLADPAQLPIGPIKRMCEDCVDAYLSQHIRLGTGPFEGALRRHLTRRRLLPPAPLRFCLVPCSSPIVR